MAFEPKYEKLVASIRKRLSEEQAKVDVRLATADGEEVKTILCSSAKAHVTSAEINGNTISYTGEVNFQVIYEGVLGEIHGLDYTAEFADKYVAEDVLEAIEPIVESVVVDVELGVLNPTTLTASAIVQSKIDVVINNDTQVLVGVNSNNVYTNVDNITYYNYLGKLKEKYDFTQDIELEDVAKVLSLTPAITIDGVKVNNDFASITANAFIDMCYLTNEENPVVRSYTAAFDFSMEVPYVGLNDKSYIMSNIYVNSTDIKVTTNIEDSKALINIVLPIVYNGYAFNPNTIENIVDLYSTTNELNTVSTSVESVYPLDTVSALEKISGSVMVEDSFVDEILGNCCNYVTVTSTYCDDDIVVEGIASTTVIYYNKEENTKNSIIVEMPFSTRLKMDNAVDGDILVNCVMSDISTKSKRGQEIEVLAKLYLYAEVYTTETNAVISEVTLGEEKMLPDCAIRIYIVRENETLWDVAKKLATSVEDIMSQNPNLELPLKENDRVYMYYQKVMQF